MPQPIRFRSLQDLISSARARGFGGPTLGLALLGFLALLATSGVSLWTANALREQSAAVEHARDVRRALDQTERRIVDAVAAERGYLLTGQESFLQAERESRLELLDDFEAVRTLLRDEPDQLRRLEDTRPLVEEGMAMTEQVVRDARDGRFVQAVEVLRSGRGASLVQEVQQRFDEIDQVARDSLRERERAANRARQANLWFSTLGSILIVLVAGLAIFQFSRNFKAIMRAHDELDEVNLGLERAVAERTEDLVLANREVERARDRAEAMLREVNHRVGNSLQLVSSFITLQRRSINDERAREAFSATQARIEAVSRVHRQLYTSDDMSQVELDAYLTSLVDELRQSLCSGERACALSVEAEPLKTTTDRTVAVGVLVAELVTNAVKYAYPDSDGEIRIRLKREAEGRARLTVEDDGIGVSEAKDSPKGTGLGKTIIAAMARDLRTEVAYVYGPKGLSASLVFDL